MRNKKIILQLYKKDTEESLEIITPILSNTCMYFEVITSEKHLEWLKIGDVFEKLCIFNIPNVELMFKNFRVSNISISEDDGSAMIRFINTAIDN